MLINENFNAGDYVLVDVECFENYFLVGFLHIASGIYFSFELSEDSDLNADLLSQVMFYFCTIGFNSLGYDLPVIFAAIKGYDCQTLKTLSNEIIQQDFKSREIEEKYGVLVGRVNHIDLIEVAPLDASLKLYGARLHSKEIIELPYDHDKLLTKLEADEVKTYNKQDLLVTKYLFCELKEQIDLRIELSQTYRVDLRSKSDAQIAEAVIASELERATQRAVTKPRLDPNWSARYNPPPSMQFKTPTLQALLQDVCAISFTLGADGKPRLPAALTERPVIVSGTAYTLGIGGLHSREKCQGISAGNGFKLFDRDVASYYPRIIISQQLIPKHLGKMFLTVYESIVNKRLEAKAKSKKEPRFKAIADSLKIVINGSFGKFGSMYSKFYSPDLLLQVTLSGQLYLLMLIESLELAGIKIISANTDGIVIHCHESQIEEMNSIVKEFESQTGFETEETEYAALYSRDVNNYIAIKTDGSVKGKGSYFNPWGDPKSGATKLSKNPATTICIEAAIEHITKNANIENFICEQTDIRKFVSVRTVNGGAHLQGEHVGKAVRWYYARGQFEPLRYKTNGHQVGDSEGARPLMKLCEGLPSDLDFTWYVRRTKQILLDIGYTKKVESLSFF